MRVASLQPSITVTLQALDRLDALCTHTKYCLEILPELAGKGLPVLHDSWSFDKPGEVETLRAATPDLVLASVPYRLESLAAILKAGLPVLALAPHSLADIYADVRLIASVVHAVPEGERLIAGMQATIAATRAETAQRLASDRPLVYCEEWGKPLIHSQHWVAELVEAAGAHFVGVPGAHTTPEAIAALSEEQQPDVILFAWCGAGDRVPLARVIEQRHWSSLRAVREGRVHCIPDPFLNTPAHTLLRGLACIAAAAHPALFPAQPAMLSLNITNQETAQTTCPNR